MPGPVLPLLPLRVIGCTDIPGKVQQTCVSLPRPPCAEAQDTLGSLQDIEAYFQALVTALGAVGVPGG